MNPLQMIVRAGTSAIFATGKALLLGEAVDAITGVFDLPFGEAIAYDAQGNQWGEPIRSDNRFCWNWPSPLRFGNDRKTLYKAQVAINERDAGDLICWANPALTVFPHMEDWPTADGWQGWLAQNPNPRHADAFVTLQVWFRGPFVLVSRAGPQYMTLAGIVDDNGAFRPLTMGQSRQLCGGHNIGTRPRDIADAIEAWQNVFEGRTSEIPPELTNLLFSVTPQGVQDAREFWLEQFEGGGGRPIIIGALLAAALLLL